MGRKECASIGRGDGGRVGGVGWEGVVWDGVDWDGVGWDGVGCGASNGGPGLTTARGQTMRPSREET